MAVAVVCVCRARANGEAVLTGRVTDADRKEVVNFATASLKGTQYAAQTNGEGEFTLSAPAGEYTLVVSAFGYRTVEAKVSLTRSHRRRVRVELSPNEHRKLGEVTVAANRINRVKQTAYNVVAVDTRALQNTTKTLSDALTQLPGMKLRESGGVGSDLSYSIDGFTGKHVKVFIDGVPQEGVGKAFDLNNIPAGFAERIEVYKGVVPVGFGTDALGGVINIVTNKRRRGWFVDASYSYGSFNTHRSHVNFGQTLKNGFTYEVNAFQNYSDNDYYIDTPVEDFATGGINRRKLEHVRRFHDMYHNEAVQGKVGLTGKKWADRLLFGFTWANYHKDIQNGVLQTIVFGDKFREGHSFMPSLEYSKRDLGVKGLDVQLTANYNNNLTHNVDTSGTRWNWRGETTQGNGRGEQAYQDAEFRNENWNTTFTANYRLLVHGHDEQPLRQEDGQEHLRAVLPPDAFAAVERHGFPQILLDTQRGRRGRVGQFLRLSHDRRQFLRAGLGRGGHVVPLGHLRARRAHLRRLAAEILLRAGLPPALGHRALRR